MAMTASRVRRPSSALSYGSPWSFLTSTVRNSGGRGRLPVWVVRMRSWLVFIALPPVMIVVSAACASWPTPAASRRNAGSDFGHPVSAVLFRLVKRLVHPFHQVARTVRFCECGDPEAHRHGPPDFRNYLVGNARSQPVEQHLRHVELRLGQEEGEFLPAPAGDVIAPSQAFAHQPGNVFEHRVSGLVAKLVVDDFEQIDIGHREA